MDRELGLLKIYCNIMNNSIKSNISDNFELSIRTNDKILNIDNVKSIRLENYILYIVDKGGNIINMQISKFVNFLVKRNDRFEPFASKGFVNINV